LIAEDVLLRGSRGEGVHVIVTNKSSAKQCSINSNLPASLVCLYNFLPM
jgi:hypothetical protein